MRLFRSEPRSNRLLFRALLLAVSICPAIQPQSQLWTLTGTTNERLGDAVDGGEDVDGDGTPDVIVGSSNSSVGGPTFGTARVLDGASGAVIRSVHGTSAGSGFGAQVAMLGDLNGDLRADFAVGAPTDGTGGLNAGLVRVFSGIDGSVLFTVIGSPGEQLGTRVAAAGDVDRDGVPDLILGTPFATANAGRLDVISGATQAILRTSAGTGTQQLGGLIGGRGDANGDGVPDVLAANVAAGLMNVRSGTDFSVLFTHSIGSDLFTSVAFVGDVDQDGRDDYAYGFRTTVGSAGVSVRSGATGAQLFSNSPPGVQILAGVGDVDGDCVPDLASTIVTGLFGTFDLVVRSGAGGAVIASASFTNNSRDVSIGRAGDVDGDGFADIIVGARQNGLVGATNLGVVSVWDMAFTGTPPRVKRVGLACEGSASNYALCFLSGCPVIGQAMSIQLRNALPNAPSIMVLGAPVSFDLSPYGMPDCSLHAATNGFNIFFTADGTGSGGVGPISLPNDPAVVGAAINAQYVCIDMSANAAGIVTSNGLEIVIGD